MTPEMTRDHGDEEQPVVICDAVMAACMAICPVRQKAQAFSPLGRATP
jgi:hypothetical protein